MAGTSVPLHGTSVPLHGRHISATSWHISATSWQAHQCHFMAHQCHFMAHQCHFMAHAHMVFFSGFSYCAACLWDLGDIYCSFRVILPVSCIFLPVQFHMYIWLSNSLLARVLLSFKRPLVPVDVSVCVLATLMLYISRKLSDLGVHVQ